MKIDKILQQPLKNSGAAPKERNLVTPVSKQSRGAFINRTKPDLSEGAASELVNKLFHGDGKEESALLSSIGDIDEARVLELLNDVED